MESRIDQCTLCRENQHFARTGGISRENRGFGFLPAFRDESTGALYLSRLADGRPAPIHVLDGLPEEIVAERSAEGAVRSLKRSVVSGFIRAGRFYTRAEAAAAVAN